MKLLRDEREVVTYLLARQFLGPAHIVDGQVHVSDVSRRNRNFRVDSGKGPSFVVKQAVSSGTAATLAHEAGVYDFLDHAGFDWYLPGFHRYDPENHVLIVSVIPGSENLGTYHRRLHRFSRTLAGQLGKGLGALHTHSAVRATGERLPHSQPRAFHLHRLDFNAFLTSSRAALEFVGILQQSPALCNAIDAVRGEWKNDETTIHGDLRWDNCVVYQRSCSLHAGILLVDWEFAGTGDGWWDVGAVLAEYLLFWLDSIPIGEEIQAQCAVGLARHPLKRMWPAIRAFWQAYKRALSSSRAPSSKDVVHAVQLAAVRLVQVGYEQSQTEERVTAKGVAILQLASNILDRPREAAVQMLGFELNEIYP